MLKLVLYLPGNNKKRLLANFTSTQENLGNFFNFPLRDYVIFGDAAMLKVF